MLKSPFIIKLRTLAESINSKLIIGLVLVSILLIFIHRMGVLDIEKNLLDEGNFHSQYTYGSTNVLAQSAHTNNVYTVTCTPQSRSNYSYCGIAFTLNENWPEEGANLKKYHTIQLKIKLKSNVDEPRIRVSLRNYNTLYSTPDDAVSLKYNSISYAPAKYPDKIRVPLNSFQVESWWVEEQNIEFANAQLDFSNVAILEFVTDTLAYDSQATLVISEATLYGELISERLLIWSLIAMSLVVVCTLVAMQHYKLHIASITDTLTGLFNRRGLDDWVSSAISDRVSNANLTMFYFDIDDFKKVNDSYGHLVGDELLRAFCNTIRDILKESQYAYISHAFARLSGDEFALVFQNLKEEQIEHIANKIMFDVQDPLNLSCGSLKLNFSLGIASSDTKTKSFNMLLSKADSAMYHAKKSGKGHFKIFDESVAQDVLFRKMVAEQLAHALHFDLFHLVFMPIYHTQSLQITGCEVLLRCDAEKLQGIGPDKFIPIAEQYDLIDKIDTWVIENTFKSIVRFNKLNQTPAIVFSVNISANQLHNQEFVRQVKHLIEKYQVDTNLIELEITETSLVETDGEAIQTLNKLKSLGLSLALDDFGTGYTAFNQLLNYPVDCLKIDKSFTDQIPNEQGSDTVMVNAILSIANSYRLKTTAEGIEHKHQLIYLKNHCCDKVQGYYFCKPIRFDDFVDYCICANQESRATAISD